MARRWAAVVVTAAALGSVGAVLAHAYATPRASNGLPLLHGQASWAPGARPAPAFAPHGTTAIVAFLGSGCRPCVLELHRIVRRLAAAERPVLVFAPASAADAYGVAPGRRLVLVLARTRNERTAYAFPLAP